MSMLLESAPPEPLPGPRTIALLDAELRHREQAGELDLPIPGHGRTPHRWSALAEFGRIDLTLARLAEGHTDALAILAEAGRCPVPHALYGVWAARAGGSGARIVTAGNGLRLVGTIRFCSGATIVDRALVVAAAPNDGADGWLVEIDLASEGIHRDKDSWPAIGMDASDSLDVRFQELPVTMDMVIGGDDWYLRRRGFALGGGGVAAVWLGGAMGVLDSVVALLRGSAVNEHQLAHVGMLFTALRSAEALLARTAYELDACPDGDPQVCTDLCRAAAERAAGDVLNVAPRITGPGLLCWDRRFAQQLADLGVYIRQHHGEADLARLGQSLIAEGPEQ